MTVHALFFLHTFAFLLSIFTEIQRFAIDEDDEYVNRPGQGDIQSEAARNVSVTTETMKSEYRALIVLVTVKPPAASI